MTASSNPQPQAREQLSAKDNTVMYGAGYALVTVLLIWLDWSGLPTDTSSDSVTRWIGSFGLLIACLTLLWYILEALGKATLPDDHSKGTTRIYIGALMSILLAIGFASFSHCLDDKIIIYKIFWIQLPALPGAYVAVTSLGAMMDGRGELKILFAYGLVDILLWYHMHNFPVFENGRTAPTTDNDLWAFLGFLLGLFVLLIANLILLILTLENVVMARVQEIPNGRVLITLGAFMGIGIMILGVMLPLELVFHVLDGKHWMYQILLAEQGALPGAHFIGGSAWLAKIYAGQESVLPQYSAVNTEEAQT